jgi:ABC-type lipoprotein release transport system permease subunit
MSAAPSYWRGTRWRSRRQVLVAALICGLLGTVALGALAGARRTDTAYGRENRIRGGAIVDAARMGSQPLALALAVAAGAVLSLALALLASVRQRRRELALLKTLGLTRRQVRAAVAWQASVILAVAGLAGIPLGVAAGHWAWAAFATSLGAVPVTVVPVAALLAGFVALLVTGNLLAAVPGAVAARTRPAALLRAG